MDEITLQEILTLVKGHWSVFLCAFIFACIGTFLQFLVKPPYSAQGSFLIEISDSNPFSMMSAKLSGFGGEKKIEKLQPYVDYLESVQLKNAIAEKLIEIDNRRVFEDLNTETISLRARLFKITGLTLLKDNQLKTWNRMGARRLLKGKIAIYSNKKGNISITVRSQSPETSVLVANLILENAMQSVLAHDLKELDDAGHYIEDQISGVNLKIKLIQSQIGQIRSQFARASSGTVGMDIRSLQGIKSKIMNSNTELVHIQKLIKRIKKQKQDYIGRNRLLRLKREEEYVASRIDALEKVLSDLISSTPSTPNLEESVQDLLHEREFQYRYSGDLKKQLIQIGVQRISVTNRIRNVRRAGVDTVFRRDFPYIKMFISCLIVFLIVVSILWLRKHLAVAVVESKRDLTDLGFRYIGNLPNLFQSRIQELIARAERKSPGHCEDYPDIFMPGDTVPRYNEPQAYLFGSIRSKIIHFMDFREKNLKTIVIVSPMPGDGKTFVAGRLATVFSQMEKKVLLIDADLLKRDLSKTLGLGDNDGLAQVLSDKCSTSEVITKNSLYPNLFILPAGKAPKFKSDLIMNGRFSSMIEQLKVEFDLIVIDTPALLLAHDAIVPIKTADFTLVSVTEGKTELEQTEKIKEELQIVPKCEIGFLLNRSARMEEYYYNGDDSKKMA